MKKMKKLCLISLKDKDKKWVVVACANIMWVHAHDGYCTIYTTGKSFDVWATHKDYVEWLNTRCHIKMVDISRGNAVNEQYINSFSRDGGLFLKAPHDKEAIPLNEDGYNTVLTIYPGCTTLVS